MLDIKERDKSVDFAKGIAIIAVSFGHVMPVLYGNEDVVSKLCYSFELAVFFIVSGYLQFGKTGRGLLNYIKHSASSLLYPYVMFTAVIFVSDSMLNLLSQGFDQYIQSFPTRICSIVTWGAGACWFFPTFFISEMIAYFCRRDSRIQNIIKMFVLIIAGSVMCGICLVWCLAV